MKDVEQGLKQLGEDAGRGLAADVRPRPAALRRIRMRRRLLGGSVALCVAGVVAGGVVVAGPGPQRAALPPAEERRDEPPGPPERAEGCDVPFEPTYLPPGFSARARQGSGGGATPQPDAPTVAHFRGSAGRFVDVVVSPRVSFAQTDSGRVTVLGRHGNLGAIHEGYSVEFRLGRCRYELLGYGVTRRDLRDFAEGLVGTEPEGGPYFGAVWPEDTLREARRGCAGGGREEPVTVAMDFASEELRWGAILREVEERKRRNATVTLRPEGERVTDRRTESGVRVEMREILPGCWSVVSVSPLAERRLDSLSVGVNGREVTIVFERYGATTASVEFGYGTHSTSTHWSRKDGEEITRLHVNGVRRSTGHFLVLLRDAEGNPFTAIGRPLPPGDFAAG